MGKETIKIFIASSAELEQDRKAFRELLSVENDRLHYKGLYLELVQWEYFFNAVSQSGKQDDYNQKLKECDMVICLFYKKAGKYTQLEFDTALKQFHATGAPLIYTYFKEPDGQINEGQALDDAAEKSRQDLLEFKKRLQEIGHFYTRYNNIDNLKLQFLKQLDILRDQGYEKLKEEVMEETKEAIVNYINKINTANINGDDNLVVQGDNNNVNITTNNDFRKITIINSSKNDIKPASRFLCRQLIEALQESSKIAREFLEDELEFLLPAEREKWESKNEYLDNAKEKIIESYPSIVGVFFRNLFGCLNQKEYFELGFTMAGRTMQLLCFAFISRFWDLSKERKFELNPEQRHLFNRFYNENVEKNISFYADFFKTLLKIFHEYELEYPIPETKRLEADFNSNNVFLNTCKLLDGYQEQFIKTSQTPIDEFEETITSFLVSVKFLVGYKMVSVKNIGYEAIRNSAAQFVHSYSMLGDNDGVKHLFQEKAINTDAVLLFKDKYIDALNLFPFMIDLNALKDQDLSRVYFYVCYDRKKKGITYSDTYKVSSEDKKNKPDEIIYYDAFKEIERSLIEINNSEDRDITALKMGTGEKFQTLKMYEVYKAFEDSKISFLGQENS